jgi:hypothetical protein
MRQREAGLLFQSESQRALGLVEAFGLDLNLATLEQKPMLVDLAIERVLDYRLGC